MIPFLLRIYPQQWRAEYGQEMRDASVLLHPCLQRGDRYQASLGPI
jgi:hypothetical protein